jgi:alkaline phosphatase
MDFELDRKPKQQPSLNEMATTAIQLISECNPNGFILMVEGSRIDHAAHAQDATAHIHEILAFDQAFETAINFAQQDGETLVIVAADHEAGGLTVGAYNIYGYKPDQLARVRHSMFHNYWTLSGGKKLTSILDANGLSDLTAEEQAWFDSIKPDADSTDLQRAHLLMRLANVAADQLNNTILQRVLLINRIINRRALVGWTTLHAHTGSDINLYAYGPGRDDFIGNHDNTFIANYIANALGLEMQKATEHAKGIANATQ